MEVNDFLVEALLKYDGSIKDLKVGEDYKLLELIKSIRLYIDENFTAKDIK